MGVCKLTRQKGSSAFVKTSFSPRSASLPCDFARRHGLRSCQACERHTGFDRLIWGPPAGRADTNKAGMSFRINDWDSETHETHKDCDKYLLCDNWLRGNGVQHKNHALHSSPFYRPRLIEVAEPTLTAWKRRETLRGYMKGGSSCLQESSTCSS